MYQSGVSYLLFKQYFLPVMIGSLKDNRYVYSAHHKDMCEVAMYPFVLNELVLFLPSRSFLPVHCNSVLTNGLPSEETCIVAFMMVASERKDQTYFSVKILAISICVC